MEAIEKFRPAIETKLAALGLELYGLRFFRAGKRSILRVFVDRTGGVKISECEAASRELSMLLDVEEFAKGSPYSLEVSSPGVDWPLREERDFRRIIGHEVTVRFTGPLDGKTSLTATVISAENGSVTFAQGEDRIVVPLANIAHGKIELKFK